MGEIVLIAWAFWEIRDIMLKTACIQQPPEGHDPLCCQSERCTPEVPTTLQVAHEDMNTYDVGVGHRARELGFEKEPKEGVWNFASGAPRAALPDIFSHNCFPSLLLRSCSHRRERGWLTLPFACSFLCLADEAYSLRSASWGSGKVTEV